MSLFVTEGERLEKKVLLQLKNVLIPFIQDYSISWVEKEDTSKVVKKDDIEQTPFKAPLMRIGSRYSVFTISQKPIIPSPITVTYKFSDGTIKTETINFSNIKELKNGKIIHSLAAAKLIKDLQEGTSKYHYTEEYKNRMKSDEQATKMFDTIKEKIIELSTKYQIISKFTSFLCIKETEKENGSSQKEPEKVIISTKGIPVPRVQMRKNSAPNNKKRAFYDMEEGNILNEDYEGNKSDNEKDDDEISFHGKKNVFDVSDINLIKMANADPKEKEKSQRLLFNSLIQYQNFDGSFKLSDLLINIIGPIYGEEFSVEWKKELDGIKTNYQEVYPEIVDQFDKLIGTSISCVILTDYLDELKPEWELMKEKSEKWITEQQQQNPIQDVRQKILLSVNHKKDQLIKLLKNIQNKDGSISFMDAEESVIKKYYGKVLANEWHKELEEVKSQVLPEHFEEFNKFIGSVFTLNILKNEKFEEALEKECETLTKSIQEWVEAMEKQNPLFNKFNKNLESSLQSNKKKKSMIVNEYMDSNTFTGEKEVLSCYKEVLKDKIVNHQEKDGSFPIFSILENLKNIEGYEGPCKKQYNYYAEWVKHWFIEVNNITEKADKENATDEEKNFINILWGTLIALHIQDEISKEFVEKYKDEITNVNAFKKEYLYQNDFDKASDWVKKCFTDPKNLPLISRWWTEPFEKLADIAKNGPEEETVDNKEETIVKVKDNEKTETTQNAKETSGHDEL